MSSDESERIEKAYSCYSPFERYRPIVKYAETASKARYQCLCSLYNAGFMDDQVKIMDIDVYREQKLDGLADEMENMSLKEAYRKRAELEANDSLKQH